MNGKGKLRFEDAPETLKTVSPQKAKTRRRTAPKKEVVRPDGTVPKISSQPEITPKEKSGFTDSRLRVETNCGSLQTSDDSKDSTEVLENKPDSGLTDVSQEYNDPHNESSEGYSDKPRTDDYTDDLVIKPSRSDVDSADITAGDVVKPSNKRGTLAEHTDKHRSSLLPDQDFPVIPRNKKAETKITKLERKAEKCNGKLDKTRKKMPTKKVRRQELIFDEKKGKTKSKLITEYEPLPQKEASWNKPKKKPLTHKAVGSAKTTAVNKIHSKVHQYENDNAGVKAAHQAELMGESAYRGVRRSAKTAYRFVKNTPYRRAAKLEVAAVKNEAKLSFQKAVRDNPKLQSNPLSRLFQKRSIKRQYAAAIRNADISVKNVKKAGKAAKKVSSAATGFIRRNPMFLVYCGIFLLIVFIIMALFTTCMSMFSNSAGYAGGMSYTAEDADIDDVELVYTQWETDLRQEIAEIEDTQYGYDEYRYDLDEIGHSPLALMAFLTAIYDNFSYGDVESALRAIFAEQYKLTLIPETETRTRLETLTGSYYDPETGETVYYEYEEEADYTWRILNISLTVKPLTDIIYPFMTEEQRQRYDTLMQTDGARQYVASPFAADWRPRVTNGYGYRIHPISGERDYHKGIDIAFPSGTEILAGFDGTVVTAGYDASYGNYVIIDDGNGLQARYAHCLVVSVSEGQQVTVGSAIAAVGSTGNSTGPHLHLEIVKDGRHINPIFFLGRTMSG